MGALLDKDIDPRHRIRDVSTTFTYLRMSETPVATMAVKGKKPKSSLYEWPVKGRHVPSDNAIADNVDVADNEIINNESLKGMVQGRVQKSRIVVGVDDVAEELGEEYAVQGGLLADNLKDGMILAKENMEVTFLKTGDSQAYTDANNPRKLRGLGSWMRTANPADGDLPIRAFALTPAGNIITGKAAATDISEDNLLNIIQSIATACRSNRNLHVFASPALRRQISSWLKFEEADGDKILARRFNQDLKTAEISMTVERVKCDFGTFFIHTHYYLPAGIHCYFLDMANIKVRPVRAPGVRELEYRGGAHKRMIEYIQGLEVANPQGNGKITT